jgi:hypothetical protein
LTVWECLYILKFCDHNYSYILNYYLMAIADFCRFHICRHRHWLTNPLLFLYKWEIQILFMHSHNILIIYNLHTKHWCRSFAPRFATNLPCTWCQIITFVFTFIISTNNSKYGNEWCCLTPNENFPQIDHGDNKLHSISPRVDMSIHSNRHIIHPIPNQPVFALSS